MTKSRLSRRLSSLPAKSTVLGSLMRLVLPRPSSMDRTFTVKDWTPSAHPDSAWPYPNDPTVRAAITVVTNTTKALASRPYNPKIWAERGASLLVLGYPELATGDAYKAKLLCEAAENPNDVIHKKVKGRRGMRFQLLRTFFLKLFRRKNPDGQTLEAAANNIRREAYFVLISGLRYCLSTGEAIFHCKMAMMAYADDERFADLLAKLNQAPINAAGGQFVAVNYPWMGDSHRKRSVSTLTHSSKYIKGRSDGRCEIRESSMTRPPATSRKPKRVQWVDAESDFYGVIAMQNIPAQSLIFRDVTITGETSVKHQNLCENCCGQLGFPCWSHIGCRGYFCELTCRDMALNSYHFLICRDRFEWLKRKVAFARDEAPNHMLLLRFLAAIVAEESHPLDNDIVAMLSSHTNGTHMESFSLQDQLTIPFRILTELGIDIFADTRFETWVLMTLWHRLTVNKRIEKHEQGGTLVAINPCFNMLNHSCGPNARWMNDALGTTVQVYATRDIKKGEEIFISYLNDMKRYETPDERAEKAEKLKNMFGWPCKCEWCALAEWGL